MKLIILLLSVVLVACAQSAHQELREQLLHPAAPNWDIIYADQTGNLAQREICLHGQYRLDFLTSDTFDHSFNEEGLQANYSTGTTYVYGNDAYGTCTYVNGRAICNNQLALDLPAIREAYGENIPCSPIGNNLRALQEIDEPQARTEKLPVPIDGIVQSRCYKTEKKGDDYWHLTIRCVSKEGAIIYESRHNLDTSQLGDKKILDQSYSSITAINYSVNVDPALLTVPREARPDYWIEKP